MTFFTVDDVLNTAVPTDPTEPVTIEAEQSVREALGIMFENDYSQLPVTNNGIVIGAITHRSIEHSRECSKSSRRRRRGNSQ